MRAERSHWRWDEGASIRSREVELTDTLRSAISALSERWAPPRDIAARAGLDKRQVGRLLRPYADWTVYLTDTRAYKIQRTAPYSGVVMFRKIRVDLEPTDAQA